MKKTEVSEQFSFFDCLFWHLHYFTWEKHFSFQKYFTASQNDKWSQDMWNGLEQAVWKCFYYSFISLCKWVYFKVSKSHITGTHPSLFCVRKILTFTYGDVLFGLRLITILYSSGKRYNQPSCALTFFVINGYNISIILGRLFYGNN